MSNLTKAKWNRRGRWLLKRITFGLYGRPRRFVIGFRYDGSNAYGWQWVSWSGKRQSRAEAFK